MLIPLADARTTAASVLTAPALRFAADGLHSNFLRETGHMYLGATALPGVKRGGVWHVDQALLDRALQELAAVAAAPGRLVPLGLPWTELNRGCRFDDDWRLAVQGELVDRAARVRRRVPAADLLDAGLDPAVQRLAVKELSRLLGGVREPDGRGPLVVAGVVVMEVVRRRAGVWSIPARWAEVLDRWRAEHVALLARAQRCAGCGAVEDLSGRTVAGRALQNLDWRSSGADGWITQCPACAGGEHRLYGGSMRGVRYTSERRRATRADGYLCVVCGVRQAAVWDHCHEAGHDFVRGPACASCNQDERAQKGIWRTFWNHGLAVRHLLECNGCRTTGGLPPRHLSALAAARLSATARHGRCTAEPSTVLEQLPEGGFLARLHCAAHPNREVRWEETVDAATALEWVADLAIEHS
ncbi:endonuclease domain-containing protein [Streptomyces sp. NRRL S-350]|uniref:endonuclease domain-containing protein n=1 Tax=Streptomyces sp. NRRL S-350 TaxID=1463902 RepID=UPI0004C21E48|nr:endonuclease domain-containing protein [Streptomyces sp. NRRL S-350]